LDVNGICKQHIYGLDHLPSSALYL